MELRQLEAFLAVVDEGTFTAAADRLHLVQSAVSVAVRGLERELGVGLFDRTTRRVRLTEAGRALVEPGRATLAGAAAARDSVAEVGDGTRGTIRIGIMHAQPGVDLAALLGEFHRRRPRVRLLPATSPQGSEGLVRDVVEHRLDLAIAALDPSSPRPELHVDELSREPIRLACPPEHPLAGRSRVDPVELSGEPFIDVPLGWGSRASVDRFFAQRGIDRDVVVQVGDVATVTALVHAGLGIALVAPSSAPESVRAQLIELEPHPSFRVCMIMRRDRPRSAAVSHLVDLVRARHPSSEAVTPAGPPRA
ncbi:LysR family transcriptional regulator [Pseudonocardia sp. DR1-2]|uniref:LysR family transcriptional regulator n=1 Tax=Pseudonocardia sp. DR1-2 TaxID=2951168 RepID=UPI0020446F81|nr:LysR family transcriptional regulator [Pseudonocardia sp. DR1-2]MCM3849001.1 LysR family transcriptional regulator [Pseudonocardia sp. DR1-2]